MQKIRSEVVHSIGTMAQNSSLNTVTAVSTQNHVARLDESSPIYDISTIIATHSSVGCSSSDEGTVEEIIRPSLGRKARSRVRTTKRVPKYSYKVTPWLTNQVWELNMTRSSNGWDACLRSYNTVSVESPIFTCCRTGDLAGAMQLLDAGRASVYDRTPEGWTVLHASTILCSQGHHLTDCVCKVCCIRS